jgi:hypothetical protein
MPAAGKRITTTSPSTPEATTTKPPRKRGGGKGGKKFQSKPGNPGNPASNPKTGKTNPEKRKFSSDKTVQEEPIEGDESSAPSEENDVKIDSDFKKGKNYQTRKFGGMGRSSLFGSRSRNTSIRTGIR